jgi:uncharacterized protein (DUF342 family)
MSDLKVIKDHHQEFFQAHVLIGQDQTEVYFKFLRLDPGAELSSSELRDLLDEAGVVYGVNAGSIKNLAEKIGSGGLEAGEENHLVAKGKSAQHGEDGRIDFLVDPSAENVFFDVDSDDVIDYKSNSLIQNVTEEQHLATLMKPTDPEDGVDVFGQTIEARVGNPMKIKLGPNMVSDNDRIYSTCCGRFIKEEDTLSVSPVYVVREDVGYRVGNINFIGKVEAQKDILDDFSVFAKEGIEVNGIVGAATVESDGSIILNGGMNGKGKGFLRSQGLIEAKYLNEVTVVAWGDISVQKSIINSIVKTKGKVDSQHGSVIGGEVTALMGVDVGSVGSDLGVITTLVAGQDYELKDRMKAYESQLLEIGQEVDRIDRIIGPILADKNKLTSLSVDKKKALKGLLEQLKRYREEQGRIRLEAEALEKETTSVSIKEIVVRKVMYSGVRIVIGNCKKVIKSDIKGPIRLREDLENDTVSITSITL